MTNKDAVYIIQVIYQTGYKLTPWEDTFLKDMLGRQAYTYNMDKKIMDIYEKATGGGKYQRREIVGGKKC